MTETDKKSAATEETTAPAAPEVSFTEQRRELVSKMRPGMKVRVHVRIKEEKKSNAS